MTAYGDKHNDFENSGPWLTQIKKEIQDTADGYFPQLPRIYNDQGVKEFNDKNYEKAIQYYNIALKFNPSDEIIVYNRARAFSENERYDLALKDYDNFFSSGNQQAADYNERGVVKYFLKDYPGAIIDFSKAIEMDAVRPNFYVNRANSKGELNDYIGAISDYTKAVDLQSYNYEAYYLRGYAKFHLKQFHQALIDFNKAIELGGDDKSAYRFRGELKLELHDYKGCIEDCDKVILNHPTASPNSFFLRGRANYLLGYKTKACEDWSKAGEQGNKEAYDYISKYCK